MLPINFSSMIEDARGLLGLTNRDVARLTGLSLRSVERRAFVNLLVGDGARPLIERLYGKDPVRAEKLAMALGRRIEDFGLRSPSAPVALPPAPVVVAPPLPPPPPVVVAPPPVPQAKKEHIDSLLVAASAVTHQPAEDLRPMVKAVILRAAEMGIGLPELAAQFNEAVQAAPRVTPSQPDRAPRKKPVA